MRTEVRYPISNTTGVPTRYETRNPVRRDDNDVISVLNRRRKYFPTCDVHVDGFACLGFVVIIYSRIWTIANVGVELFLQPS